MVGRTLQNYSCTFEPLGSIELKMDMLSYHTYYELRKGANIYFILKLISQIALFHHETTVTPPFKAKVFRCKLIKS